MKTVKITKGHEYVTGGGSVVKVVRLYTDFAIVMLPKGIKEWRVELDEFEHYTCITARKQVESIIHEIPEEPVPEPEKPQDTSYELD
ncbi:hypothetical protein CHLORIS_198 [Vibrio phage Chloris]|uniref:Uncharacterized protein n=1 Tax=Vibrio phage Gary TaxID=2801534 RepID=A0A7U0J3Y4_9CAUD|nr:hypothetical protein KNV71_gp112 [Vibrio phage Gary]QQO89818.1 hypothetical protein GRLPWR_204 [Vibrio phage GRLPWR]QQV88288.1 hypothetical protein GARY_207 [Vibrio phage Gary]WBU76607.1 hypothetical protein CHLORIS_198 [Vibrio phage Chloris]